MSTPPPVPPSQPSPPPTPYGSAAPGSPAPPRQPQYPAPATLAPGYAAPTPAGPRPKGPSALGIVALAASVVGTVAGAVIVYLAVSSLGSQAIALEQQGGTTTDPDEVFAIIGSTWAILGGFAVYAVLGLWGCVQGIVATVLNRGRGWAIAAIAVAVAGFLVLFAALWLGVMTGFAPVMMA